jgi:hypothetical protein
VAQQALCNALGVSDLHWVWAIAASSGPRLFFRTASGAYQPSRRESQRSVFNLEYTFEISLPKWLRDPPAGYVTALSEDAPVYDFMRDEGHTNIGAWIDLAAQRRGPLRISFPHRRWFLDCPISKLD